MLRILSHRMTAGVLTVTAGGLLVAGAALPWVRLLAGLHTYSGLTGVYGRALGVGGVVLAVLGGLMLVQQRPVLRWAAGLLGFALATVSAWVLANALGLSQALAAEPLLVAGIGPGPVVCLAGALLALATMLLPRPVRRATHRARPGAGSPTETRTTSSAAGRRTHPPEARGDAPPPPP